MAPPRALTPHQRQQRATPRRSRNPSSSPGTNDEVEWRPPLVELSKEERLAVLQRMGKDADSQFQNELNRVSGLKDDYMFTYDRLTLQNKVTRNCQGLLFP